MDIDLVNRIRQSILNNIDRVIFGKSEVIDLAIMAMMCQGHLLIEDVPGTGKTVLAKAISKTFNADFKRIQFTPDMLPSDVTGVSIYNQSTRDFEFKPGPIMAHIVLADEINRATPKTQSALLEAMEEKQITVDGKTYELPQFFMVIATQNPIDLEGTFPLPEAQLDRFMMRIRIGYPTPETEKSILKSQKIEHPLQSLNKTSELEDLLIAQREIRTVHVSEKIEDYIIDIIKKTRDHENIFLGASPRGSLVLYRLGQCKAVFEGRDFVIPDDIKFIAPHAIAHRIIPHSAIRMQDYNSEEFIAEIIENIQVPGG